MKPKVHLWGQRWDERLERAREAGHVQLLDETRWQEVVDPYNSGGLTRRISWAGLRRNVLEEELATCSETPLDDYRHLLINTESCIRLIGEDVSVPYAHALSPIVDNAWRSFVACSSTAGLTEAACQDLRRILLHRLSELTSSALGEMFSNNRTLADVALSSIICGSRPGSSTTEYQGFCRRLHESKYMELFSEFPVLPRLIAEAVGSWNDSSREMLARISVDRDLLEERFDISKETPMTSVVGGLSDAHRGGRTVAILTFGDAKRVVYKPRSVAIEQHFQNLLATVSSEMPSDPLRRFSVLSRNEYGYVEYVSPETVKSPTALPLFYRNSGRLLAILYVLGATDCHWENLIATSDQLLLVDAETLFEGTPISLSSALMDSDGVQSNLISDSVLGTGMLPSWISVGSERSIDISALGAFSLEETHAFRQTWCFVNTDDMAWGERRIEVSQPECLPVSVGEVNPLWEYGDDLILGFRETIALLMRPRVQAIVRSKIEAFRGSRRRIVIRPTRTYVLIQRFALQPDALRDSDGRALELEKLARAYTGTNEIPKAWPLLQHEITCMEGLDVPYFEGIVGSPHIVSGDNVIVENYYLSEGLDEALSRLEHLTESESRWQCRLIRGSLAAHRFEMSSVTESAPRASGLGRPSPRSGDDSAIAELIAAETLFQRDGTPTWLTVSLLADATRVQLGLVPHGLYDGRAGIAAFFYDCNEEALANEVMRPVEQTLRDADAAQLFRYVRDIGFGMSGIGGLLRLYRNRAEVGSDPNIWDKRSDKLISAITDELLTTSEGSDLVSGLAGLAAPIAARHSRMPTKDTTRVLTKLGEILAGRQNDDGGWSLAPGKPALAGLSHGASGISVALAEISVAVKDDYLAEAAARGVDFENVFFDSRARNWRDARKNLSPNDQLSMHGWCHGSVGIGLARLRMIELLGTHEKVANWTEDLSNAIEGAISAPSTWADHLCCGNLGRATVITMAGKICSNRRWQSAGSQLAERVISSADGNPENYRLLLGIDGTSGLRLPGLMTGLAGIGMFLRHRDDFTWVRQLLL